MADLHTRTATFASLKCRSKCDFWDKLRKSQKKGKRAVFPYEKCKLRKHFPIPFFLDCVTNNTLSDTTQSSLLSIIFPNQPAAKKQAILVYFFFLLFASRCILIFYSIDLISSNPNFTSNLRHRIFFTI